MLLILQSLTASPPSFITTSATSNSAQSPPKSFRASPQSRLRLVTPPLPTTSSSTVTEMKPEPQPQVELGEHMVPVLVVAQAPEHIEQLPGAGGDVGKDQGDGEMVLSVNLIRISQRKFLYTCLFSFRRSLLRNAISATRLSKPSKP